MVFRLIPFVFLLAFGACAPVDPAGGGQIRARCVVDGGSIQRPVCGEQQYVLCLIGTDAGNGESQARCCDNSETEASCLQRAGLTPADGGRAQTADR